MSATAAAQPAAATTGTAAGAPAFARVLAPLLLLTGAVGLAAAFVLAVEKFRLLTNPLYVPSCSFGETLSCAGVMQSDQAEVFGFPNPLLGIAGFAIVLASGLALALGGRLPRLYWIGLQAGLTLAVVFVHWLIFQTLYRIGALCPYCMVVWAVTIPAFWYVTLRVLSPTGFLARNHGVLLTAWLLVIAALVYERFWAPWDSVFA